MKFLLLILFFVCKQSVASTENAIIKNYPSFSREASPEKDVWYGNLATKAIIFYERACNNGESKACFNLGLIFDAGELEYQDKKKAIKAYALACDKEYAAACNNLGILYGTGEGAIADFDLALTYFSKACKLNRGISCKNQQLIIDHRLEYQR